MHLDPRQTPKVKVATQTQSFAASRVAALVIILAVVYLITYGA